jgi:predicted MPP superfamily phosphohydrolase
MATYFISDIHGEYDLFIKLLKKINFNSHDTLYILGDIIDKGKDSIKLLKFISKQNNMIAIMGNHEHAFSEFVKAVIDKTPTENYNEIISKVQAYFSQDLERITPQEVFFILQLPYFIETEEFICVHAGLEIKDNKILPLEQQQYNYIIYDRKFKNKRHHIY